MNTKYNFDEYLVNEARTIFWKVTLYSFSYMEVTDENGRTKPCERGMLKAAVEGGTLEAFGSACPFYEQSYLDAESDTYYGEALLIVRAGESGTIRATVSDGIRSASVTVAIE